MQLNEPKQLGILNTTRYPKCVVFYDTWCNNKVCVPTQAFQ